MEKVFLNAVYEFEKEFRAADVQAFSHLTDDNNPIHTDENYAASTIFGKPVVHGIFLVSMFSKIFGTIYPGNGGIYLSQSVKFLKPAFVGEKIMARVKLLSFDDVRKRGVFSCECFNHSGRLLLSGEAHILFPEHFCLADETTD